MSWVGIIIGVALYEVYYRKAKKAGGNGNGGNGGGYG